MEDAKAQYSGKLEHTPPLVFHPKHPLRLAWTLFMVRACVRACMWVCGCRCACACHVMHAVVLP